MSEGVSPSPRGTRPGFAINTHNLIGGLIVAVLALLFLGWAFYVPNALIPRILSAAFLLVGIAAAIGNNGIGIAGIAWAAGILPIKVCTISGCVISDIACGILFGANFATLNLGMRVVENLSLGGAGYSQTLKDAVDNAIQSNVLVIASAGNDGKSTVLFPAGYPGVMAVGASTPTNDRAVFSTYGSHLSVIAPGVVVTTIPASVAAGTSTLSKPTPQRATILSSGQSANSRAL